jgi:hypothetical protein
VVPVVAAVWRRLPRRIPNPRTRRTGDLRPQVLAGLVCRTILFGLHMQKTKVQDLCTAITNETDPKKLVALIKELRSLLADQQAKLEAKIATQREP